MNKMLSMKRTLVFLLMMVMTLGLFACNSAKTTVSTLPSPDSVGNFQSYDELKTYLEGYFTQTNDGSYLFRNSDMLGAESAMDDSGVLTTTTPSYNDSADQSEDSKTYSETNNQVEGVKESDRILTDGYSIYVTSNTHFYIIDADTLEIVFTQELENGYYIGMYLYDGRVVLLSYEYTYEEHLGDPIIYPEVDPDFTVTSGASEPGEDGDVTTTIIPSDDETLTTTTSDDTETKTDETYYYYYTYTYGINATVLDVSDTDNIEVVKSLYFDSSYIVDTRMIDGTVYLVMDNYAIYYGYEGDNFVPQYRDSSVSDDLINVGASDIYYMPNDNYSFGYLLMASFNVDDTEPAKVKAYLGSTYQIYMSLNNLYTIIYRYAYDEETLSYSQTTYILRFGIVNDELVYQAQGIVTGMPLNQFSMDEYEGVFRIATTGYDWSESTTTVTNTLFLLDATSIDQMTAISSLGGLGKTGERIYAVRFNGDIAYVVTFLSIDPLYKLDLSDPEHPVKDGELEEEGVSDYLHPINDSLLLGIGRQAETDGEWTYFTGVKVSLYNVDGDDPVLIENYLVEGEYSYSPVTYDHKAFVSYQPTGADFMYVAIPVFEYSDAYYHYSQSAYVFKVYLSGDLEFITKLTHYVENSEDYWYQYFDSIDRVIMIEDKIYTVSYTKIQMYDMSNDFELLQSTMLEENYYYYYWGFEVDAE
ncbi:MAG: beta-propeller domain-containing protein [Firmicutes bacterium]|nr:beta-propeller domain-containing protein [Bacillota bacterium]